MQLISLNTWGGKYFEPLIDFIKAHSQNTDIFCFQEIFDTESNVKQHGDIRANLLSEIKDILVNFQVFYLPIMRGYDYEVNPVDFDLTFGQTIFVRNSIRVNSEKDYIIYQDQDSHLLKEDFSNLPTPLQYITLDFNDKELAVFNFHGTPMPGDKLDTNRRLTEANKVKGIMNTNKGTKILVGDFNLLPQTQSIKIYENEMVNLIKKYNVKTTRSKLSPYFGKSDFQAFADYTFVSSGIQVNNFQVPNIVISDHLPMILEFS